MTVLQKISTAIILISGVQQFSHAGNLYVYRDHQGTALLTNKKVNSGSYKQEKVTYYPDTNVHRYKNWGNSEASVLPSFSRSKDTYDHIIRIAAQSYGVSEGLLKAVMHTESSFNAYARSPVGAQGLMQLMPATARRFNVNNAFDPHQNIHGGAKYLSWLLKRFNGNTSLALAAYNAGEGNVDKYGGIPPFRETRDYVNRVMSRYQNLYASGLNLAHSAANSSSSNAQDVKVLSASSQYTPSASSTPKREIVYSEGVYTDRAATRTYVTDAAIVTSNIRISE
ncbi:lytic transglycosylase domain-containing protein [Acinetobacter puyangensis]|nr:lytic transglycosylase domain-containing protein [Acinetobacter puyangensis]